MPGFNISSQAYRSKPTSAKTLIKQQYRGTEANQSVYAEVRGKYARPPPLMQKTNPVGFLAPKENSLISRPSTVGSLQPRSTSHKPQQPSGPGRKESESPIKPPRIKYRSISTNSNKPENNDKSMNDSYNAIKFPVEEKLPQPLESEKNQPEENAENPEPLDFKAPENEDEYLRDGLSYVSGLTTSSQRKYILELESLLRQEKLRRIQLEESLKKVVELNK